MISTTYSTGKGIDLVMTARDISFGDLTISIDAVELPRQVTRQQRDTPIRDRRMIAWDGEGMKLSGPDKPQHYVMFGCSADPNGVLIHKNLTTMEILEYMISIAEKYPNSIHVGYGFRYDANMIIKGLPPKYLREIKERGECRFTLGNIRWRIAWIPGKTFRVTKYYKKMKSKEQKHGNGYTSIKIDDMVSFFAAPFLNACESILKDTLTDYDREVIAHGKTARKDNTWDDLAEVQRYWTAEIRLMEEMAVKFRDVMFNAGIMLREWYGPGAIATYLISNRGLRDHIQNQPGIPAVHEASKRAYAGGRFELFRVGRIEGPVYGYDINSAYPAALSQAPSLGVDHGEWVYVANPTRIEEFGVYRITYKHRGQPRPIEFAAMPLFHRDARGSMSFPQVVQGWYWSPEASNIAALIERFPGCAEIHEGWVWRNDGTKPFGFLQEMFDKRIELGKKNVISMPYKLGPNSMYGKLAQRVGWNKETGEPPRSHCLPLAGWITSMCRAQLFRVMLQIPMHKLIAVETDGIYTTADPDTLSVQFGNGLGEWGVDRYDEMLYLQNGVYNRRIDKEWLAPKARGLDVGSVSQPVVESYFRNCAPGDFAPLSVQMRERFVGLSAALIRDRGARVHDHLGKWEAGTREMLPGGKGKRMHVSSVCAECHMGVSAWEHSHRLTIKSRSLGELSAPHSLPWENDARQEETELARELDMIEEDYIYE